jgi:hypothetical protein
MPSHAQPGQPQRAIPVAADATSRTAFHPPPQTISMAGSNPAHGGGRPSAPMAGPAAGGPQIMHGHGVPSGPGGNAGYGGGGGARGVGMPQAPSSIQMMRPQESMAPAPRLSATGYNRPRQAQAARPTSRPPTPRPSAPRVAVGNTHADSGKKKSVTTTMLVIAALVAGAIMAFAVLT